MKGKEIKNYNGKRSFNLWSGYRRNIELSKQIREYLENTSMSVEKQSFMYKLDKNINSCASYSLYRVGEAKNTYIGSYTCSNRNCNICNGLRYKSLRRKYYKFFETNQDLYHLQNIKSGKTKTVSEGWYNRKFKENDKYNFLGTRKYDLMHLTLTVPHFKETGFRGEKYYYREFIQLFNKMRKSKKKIKISDNLKVSWSDIVYGGEYGVETTVGDNGLNIHAHSLIFVKKMTKSRNVLHKVILQLWNELTVNEFSKRKKFSLNHLEGIKKGNKLITDDFILKTLNPQGATTIGLETIYSKQNGVKKRGFEYGSDAMMSAVMETISYHFEPQAFDKKYNEYNLDLLSEVLPKIYRQRLYSRYGCLEQEQSLGLTSKNNDAKEEYEDVVVDIDTGEVIEDEADHFVIRPYRVFHDKENDNEIKISKNALKLSIKLEAYNTAQALDIMNIMYVSDKKGKRYEKASN